MIISFFLLTLMFDSGVILSGEIRCWPLLGVKGLNMKDIIQFSQLLTIRNVWQKGPCLWKVHQATTAVDPPALPWQNWPLRTRDIKHWYKLTTILQKCCDLIGFVSCYPLSREERICFILQSTSIITRSNQYIVSLEQQYITPHLRNNWKTTT